MLTETYKAKAVIEEDVVAAIAAFMTDPTPSPFVIGDEYRLDLAAAVRAHEWASVTVRTKDATENLKRAAVRTASLLARPEKP
ncbi:hypothetical protein [Methylobacterium sp. J-068]|uniref:hypothetical protein n=1 Tax=Methylobacterium sp. J-068 TaxID=2836649 RepID=UPI001FBBCBAF|nr:hypothetical protein [Methylobacterium sp. J-068]MCJ2034597.1 hypothetical protein [Methylobacterium sp. J-068]